jgi:hypothetical protein
MGILYRARVPKLKVETPTANANEIEKTKQKRKFGSKKEANKNLFFLTKITATIKKNTVPSKADISIRGFFTSHK